MKTAIAGVMIAALIAVALVMAGRNSVSAHDPNATSTPTPEQGCGSLTPEDWVLPNVSTSSMHINEYDPAVVTPSGYLKLDEARLLVWFAGLAHGLPGYTSCARPVPTPTPLPTATPTPEPKPKLVLIGCRWPDGHGHDFSAPDSPNFHICVQNGGNLEFEPHPSGKYEYKYWGRKPWCKRPWGKKGWDEKRD